MTFNTKKNFKIPTVTSSQDNNSLYWLILITAIYVFRIYSWSMSELWYDEILTLQLFGINTQNPIQIFLNYSIANNHFLNSCITWWAIRFLNFNCIEHLLRLPAILFGWGTLALVCLHWQCILGKRRANLGAVLLAISPVFGAFAYQMRGYSMAMFFTTLALSGMIEIIHKNRLFRGQILLCISSFLLPLTMPSAAIAVPVIALYLFLYSLRESKKYIRSFLLAVPCFFAAVLSGSYYLFLGDQFTHAAQAAGGWDSSLLVLLAVLGGYYAHIGPAIIPMYIQGYRLFKKKMHKYDGILLTKIAFIPILITILMRFGGHAPFPRVYLVLFPIFTYAALLSCKETPVLKNVNTYFLFLLILFSGVVIENTAYFITKAQISEAKSPQNLLQQYYRNSTDSKDMIQFLLQSGLYRQGPIVINAFDEIPFQFYWQLNNLPVQAVFAAHRLPPGFQFQHHSFRVIARNEQEAASLFQKVGYTGAFYKIFQTANRSLFTPGMVSLDTQGPTPQDSRAKNEI